jgi:hypothetical protein
MKPIFTYLLTPLNPKVSLMGLVLFIYCGCLAQSGQLQKITNVSKKDKTVKSENTKQSADFKEENQFSPVIEINDALISKDKEAEYFERKKNEQQKHKNEPQGKNVNNQQSSSVKPK